MGTGPVDTIAISSDEEELRVPKARRGRAATSATSGRSTSSKGKSKALTGASARRSKLAEEEETGDVEETAAEANKDFGAWRSAILVPGDTKGRNDEHSQAQDVRRRENLEDVVRQRDRLSGQLDELFRLRQTEMEKLLVDQKAQYEARLKAQDDTIQELQDSLSRVDALPSSGGSTSLHFLTRETADEEKQHVQREVSRLRKIVMEKDNMIGQKNLKIKELDDAIQVLRTDLKTEIENTKALSSRSAASSSSKHASKLPDPKNAMVIRLYEELTGILITNVKHEPGQYKEDDAVYTCVQTTSNNKSLNFTLKFFQEIEDEETPSNAKHGRIVEKVIYTPLLLAQETKEFVAQLDFLAGPFTFQKAQMNVFMKTLTSYLEGEGESEEPQSDASGMEVEDN